MFARALKLSSLAALTAVSLLLTGASGRAQEAEARSIAIFDQFVGFLGDCDLGARLDNLAIGLQNAPRTRGYILIYTGKYDLPARIPAYRNRIHDYLVNTRGVDDERLVIVDAGYRQELTTELWIVPDSAPAPEPTGTINVKSELEGAFKFAEECIYLPDETEQFADPSEGAADDAGASAPVEVVVGEQALADEASEPEAAEVAEEAAEAQEETAEPEAEEETAAGEAPVWWHAEGYARALQIEGKARGCIIFYAGGEREDFGQMQQIVERGKLELVEKYGVKAERLQTIFGGYRRAAAAVELWIVPAGASLPVPTPDLETMEKAGGTAPPATEQPAAP